MKLDCVLTACNYNPLYCDFIPIFIKTWNKLYPGVDVKIIFVNDSIPDEFKEYNDNLILFKPIDNIPTAFISQYVRLLYPAILNYENGILITDADMLPMNRTYYVKNIEQFSNDKFIYMRNVLFEHKQIAMCYNVACKKIWAELFKINSLEDIINRFKTISTNIDFSNVSNWWCIDQLHFYNTVMNWDKKYTHFIVLDDKLTGFSRLDRIRFVFIPDNIKSGYYSDYHCYRPYKKYKELNDKIFELL